MAEPKKFHVDYDFCGTQHRHTVTLENSQKFTVETRVDPILLDPETNEVKEQHRATLQSIVHEHISHELADKLK